MGIFSYLFQRKDDDRELSRQYVGHVFDFGCEVSPSLAKVFQSFDTVKKGEIVLFDCESAKMHAVYAILGTSLAILKGHSRLMSADRGAKVERLCKQSIENDYNFQPHDAIWQIAKLNAYQEIFQKSISNKNYPFEAITEFFLSECLGHEISKLWLPATGSVNLYILQVMADTMLIAITQALEFWEGK